jgi:hypothetical protein
MALATGENPVTQPASAAALFMEVDVCPVAGALQLMDRQVQKRRRTVSRTLRLFTLLLVGALSLLTASATAVDADGGERIAARAQVTDGGFQLAQGPRISYNGARIAARAQVTDGGVQLAQGPRISYNGARALLA